MNVGQDEKKDKLGMLKDGQINGGRTWYRESYLKKVGRKILGCLDRNKFTQLVNELNPWISPDPNSPNKRAIPSMKKSWYLSLLPQRHWFTFNDCKYVWCSYFYCIQGNKRSLFSYHPQAWSTVC